MTTSKAFAATQILTGPSPKGMVIAYKAGVLMAYSGCCKAMVNYDHYSEDWGCSGCESTLENQPYDSKAGPALLSNVYTPLAPDQMDVTEWVHRWTGFNLADITVEMR